VVEVNNIKVFFYLVHLCCIFHMAFSPLFVWTHEMSSSSKGCLAGCKYETSIFHDLVSRPIKDQITITLHYITDF